MKYHEAWRGSMADGPVESKTIVLKMLLIVIFALLCQHSVWSYKPVVIIHGILDTAASMNDLKAMIENTHRGTNVTVVKLFPEVESIFNPMWTQMRGVKEVLEQVMQQSKDGIHLIGFSQGGLVARAVVENCSDHNIHNFVSLSSPQMGQYGATVMSDDVKGEIYLLQLGLTSYLAKYLPKVSRELLYKLLYTEEFQKHLSIANYWNDPDHTKEYLQENTFLPILNNNNNSKFIDNKRYVHQKTNFAKLENLIIIGGPNDGVITPWQSALFAFYDENLNITEMENQKAYIEDWFGLGTLGRRNAIHSYVFENITHTSWHGSELVFMKAIEQWLT